MLTTGGLRASLNFIKMGSLTAGDYVNIANAASNVAGAIITPIQNKRMQKRQSEENQKNRDFAKEQAETQFEREKEMLRNADSYKMQSLKHAGLNPALAYGGQAPTLTPAQGATPEGKIAPQFDTGAAFQRAGTALGAAAESATNIQKAIAETRLTNATAEKQEIENKHTKDKDTAIKEAFSVYGQTAGGQVQIELGTTHKEKLTTADGQEVWVDQPDTITLDLDKLSVGTIDGIQSTFGYRLNLSETQMKIVQARIQEHVARLQEKDPNVIDAMVQKAKADYDLAVANKENVEANTEQTEMEVDTNLKGLFLKALQHPDEVSKEEWIYLGVASVAVIVSGKPELLFGGKKKDKGNGTTDGTTNGTTSSNSSTGNSSTPKSKPKPSPAKSKGSNVARSAVGKGNVGIKTTKHKNGNTTASFAD